MQPGDVDRVNVLGVGISAIDLDTAEQVIDAALQNGNQSYVCVTSVHGIMEAQKDPKFRSILNQSLLTTPDGMPTVWVGKLQGFAQIDRVFGPDLMARICCLSEKKGYTHFLYGGARGTAEMLRSCLLAQYPALRITGTYTPPFRALNRQEEQELVGIVARARPDVLWVGLSTPKQERFMADYLGKLQTRLMIGVGAAFDFHTGRIKDAPQWLKRAGLQWAHRLWQDPRRLFRRYLVNNSAFLLSAALQLSGLRKYNLPAPRVQHLRNGQALVSPGSETL